MCVEMWSAGRVAAAEAGSSGLLLLRQREPRGEGIAHPQLHVRSCSPRLRTAPVLTTPRPAPPDVIRRSACLAGAAPPPAGGAAMSTQPNGRGRQRAQPVHSAAHAVRVGHCRTLGDCAELLHQTGADLAEDSATLLQLFTAMSQRLASVELAQRQRDAARDADGTNGGDDVPESLRHVVDRTSLAISTAAGYPPTAAAEPVNSPSRSRGGSIGGSPASRRRNSSGGSGSGTSLALPDLRTFMAASPGDEDEDGNATAMPVLELLRGAPATKVNRKNLQVAPVHLFLSLEGATADQPGWICARKKKDGGLIRIPISDVQRVYNGVEYSETLHRYTQKQGKLWDYALGANCLSFFAGATAASSRTYDFICSSADACRMWVQFMDPRAASSSSSLTAAAAAAAVGSI